LKLSTLAHSVQLIKRSGSAYVEYDTWWNPNPLVSRSAGTYVLSDATAKSAIPSSGHLSEAYIKARAQLAGKVNAMSFNAGQAFAERRQTASLLTNTAYRIVSAARALRHGRLGEFQKALSTTVHPNQWDRTLKTPASKRIATHWLEYQYGWKPLLQDAYGAAELLSRHSQEAYVTSSRGVGSAKAVNVYKRTVDLGSDRSVSVSTTCKLGVTYRLDNPSRAGLAQTGLSNPALLAWELLPYSFVVDWFLPVGNYLEALDAFSGFTFVGGYQVYFTSIIGNENWNGSQRSYVSNGWCKTLTNSGSAVYNEYLLNRSVLTGFPPVGPLSFRNPLGGDPASRVATAISLLRVLFK
jgi:hypothetical protein